LTVKPSLKFIFNEHFFFLSQFASKQVDVSYFTDWQTVKREGISFLKVFSKSCFLRINNKWKILVIFLFQKGGNSVFDLL